MESRAFAVGASEHDRIICDKAASAYCVKKFSLPAVLTSAAFFSSAGTMSSRSPDSFGPSFSISSCSSTYLVHSHRATYQYSVAMSQG